MKLFRDKDFTYLCKSNYIPEPTRADLRQKSEALTAGNPVQVPKLEKDDQNYVIYVITNFIFTILKTPIIILFAKVTHQMGVKILHRLCYILLFISLH